MSAVFRLLKLLLEKRSLIFTMIVHEVKGRYSGTVGGFCWAFINPFLQLVVYWLVFSFIFRIGGGGVPFIVYYSCGVIPWLMFAESLLSSCNVIVAKSYLVKKTLFPTQILPFVSIGASQPAHFIMMAVFLLIMIYHKIPFSYVNFEVIYYYMALLLFTLGLGWFCAALNVFFRDLGQILHNILIVWFWATPIVWEKNMLPAGVRFLVSLNPLAYIVEGYRHAFIYRQSLGGNYQEAMFFWAFTLLSLFLGGHLFRKLKREFNEFL